MIGDGSLTFFHKEPPKKRLLVDLNYSHSWMICSKSISQSNSPKAMGIGKVVFNLFQVLCRNSRTLNGRFHALTPWLEISFQLLLEFHLLNPPVAMTAGLPKSHSAVHGGVFQAVIVLWCDSELTASSVFNPPYGLEIKQAFRVESAS